MPVKDWTSRMAGAARRAGRVGKTWVLPNVCPTCRHHLRADGLSVCADCAARLRPLPGPRCPQCGGVVDGPLAMCGECLSGTPRLWNQAVTVYGYNGFIRDLIHQLKYQRAVFLVPPMAESMAASWRQAEYDTPDVVTWVPMHWRRKIHRGYNQAELLARRISRILEIPAQKLVRRKKNSRKQATLGKVERNKNLKHAFVPRGERIIMGKHVLLIDDVFTTGSTLQAVAQAMNRHSPAQISVLTLARG